MRLGTMPVSKLSLQSEAPLLLRYSVSLRLFIYKQTDYCEKVYLSLGEKWYWADGGQTNPVSSYPKHSRWKLERSYCIVM